MANTLGSAAGNLIAQRALDILVNHYPALSLVASDFSNEPVKYGQTVVTRIVNPGVAQNYSTVSGYFPTDLSTSDVNILVTGHKHSTFTLNAQEISSTDRNLIEDYAWKVGTELGDAIYNDICSKFTTGSYPGSTIAPASVWGFTGVINAANTELNKRKVPKNQRVAIFNPSLYGTLWTDDRIVRQNFNNYTLGENKLPVVQDTVLTEFPDLPGTSNMVGVQLHKSAVAVATRVPEMVSDIADVPRVARVENFSHPELGITLQLRSWESAHMGGVNYSATIMYGVGVGQTGSAQLIRTS